jgi:alpha,alpha-trehalase
MKNMKKARRAQCLFVSLVFFGPALVSSATAQTQRKRQGFNEISIYISHAWGSLTRSMANCSTFSNSGTHTKSPLYLPVGMAVPREIKKVKSQCALDIRYLPQSIHDLGQLKSSSLDPQGLLYLPHPYVVPGGMFNEMYGWDSYFIIRGLLEDGKVELAKDIVRNFFFEIGNYGGVLNANRTFFLTRSQPPFLTSMVRAIYEAEKAQDREDRALLDVAYPYAVRDYELWTQAPHLAGDPGLSRYYDFGDGPVPELSSSAGEYYGGAIGYFLQHPAEAAAYLGRTGQADLIGPEFTLSLCASGTVAAKSGACTAVYSVGLTEEFYKGDRALRESGFDITFRFGPYGAGTTDYAPVELNSLLYKAEIDLEWMSNELGREEQASEWHDRAAQRRANFGSYFWNAQRGLFFDYNFKTKSQSGYEYATTFFPLWAGLATPEQAEAIEGNVKIFDRAGGIVMSSHETGAQWDSPYGWAPLQLIAVEGLRRYGDNDDADRISTQFLSMVLTNFRRDRTIHEKYNVVSRSSTTNIAVGYRTNVVGFGWTNGVFVVLKRELPKHALAELH